MNWSLVTTSKSASLRIETNAVERAGERMTERILSLLDVVGDRVVRATLAFMHHSMQLIQQINLYNMVH
jgi:hypothetical protein